MNGADMIRTFRREVREEMLSLLPVALAALQRSDDHVPHVLEANFLVASVVLLLVFREEPRDISFAPSRSVEETNPLGEIRG